MMGWSARNMLHAKPLPARNQLTLPLTETTKRQLSAEDQVLERDLPYCHKRLIELTVELATDDLVVPSSVTAKLRELYQEGRDQTLPPMRRLIALDLWAYELCCVCIKAKLDWRVDLRCWYGKYPRKINAIVVQKV